MLSMDIVVTVMMDDKATVAELADEGSIVYATGSAKRHPADLYNPGIGANLAIARALRNYADTLETQVEDLTNDGEGHSVLCGLY